MKKIGLGLGASLLVLMTLWVLLAPVERVPGVLIGGEDAGPPESWAEVNSHDNALLETNTGLPYVVTIWYYGADEGLFVYAIESSRWLARLRENPNVRIRIDDKTYEVRASEVADPQLEAAIAPRYDAKYLEQSENYDDVDEHQYVFIELSPR